MQYNGSLSLHPFARYAATSALHSMASFFFFQAEDGIRDIGVTGVQDVCSSDLNATIALRLLITERTVKKHLENIYQKLDVRSRTQAVAATFGSSSQLAASRHSYS